MNRLSLFTIGILLILPFILIAVFWSQIPEIIPIHYNLSGEADRFAAKMPAMFILPVINLFTFMLMYYLPKIDPKGRVTLEQKGYVILMLILVIFFFALFVMELMRHLGHPLFHDYIPLIFPVLILLLGNYITKVKPNYFVGIRTPWTLQNEQVWVQTHRFSGRFWVAISLIMLIVSISFWGDLPNWVSLVYVGLVAAVPIVYSYMAYQKLPDSQEVDK